MQIARLRLTGFKSFVEPTDLVIGGGLTGVVGPNGCGKSNLLEALRWVMGETSFKSMRASAMDDVIFAGTDRRPARNAAEVVLTLDNTLREAPAAWNGSDIIEITRRIEREAGSAYKINGQDVRARDVRLLFEDAATGARSAALVRQGQIGEIINAKPEKRRRILEDAAGVAGLHSRRHEAELRLKAAEGNLARLDDISGQIETQINGLKRQARQARRYKEIGADLRRAQAMAHYLSWRAADAQVNEVEGVLRQDLVAVGEATQIETASFVAMNTLAEALPGLRDAEVVRAAVLQRVTIELETLDRDEASAKARHAALLKDLEAVRDQIAREDAIASEAVEAEARIAQSINELEDQLGPDDPAIAKAAEAADTARAESEISDQEASATTSMLATAEADRGHAERALADADHRLTQANADLERLTGERALLLNQAPEADAASAAETRLVEAANQLATSEQTVETTETATSLARQNLDAAQTRDREAERTRDRHLAEVAAVKALLTEEQSASGFEPVADTMDVRDGFELALGAALGDDLDAALDETAPAHWTVLASRDGAEGPDAKDGWSLPTGAEPLADHIDAPRALTRRLAQVGLCSDPAMAQRLQPELKPGQRLVTPQGGLWRWDGFVAQPDAPTSAAKRLLQRNRLATLDAATAPLSAAVKQANADVGRADAALQAAIVDERAAREAVKTARSGHEHARQVAVEASELARRHASELQRLDDMLDRATQEVTASQGALQTAQTNLAALPSLDALRNKRDAAQRQATIARAHHVATQTHHRSLVEARSSAETRLKALIEERGRAERRATGARNARTRLVTRRSELEAQAAHQDELPDGFAERREKLLNTRQRSEAERQVAADALADAETKHREAEAVLRTAQSTLASTREARAATEARLEAARTRLADEARRIAEAFECSPDDCLAAADHSADTDLPPIETVQRTIERLTAERERLGGVNLRAEEELSELETRRAEMAAERGDLEDAIAALRQGIAKINREGKRRLLEAFDKVNAHFTRLFETLFGGGTAELQLIESDDPLEGGLELIARPPGKKPATLSLLSGGEQALTAMALIFAVFLTNPSPICVLDEVDAPLDDANVGRFCRLLDEMSKTTDTRFLVITHHPQTMARVDRLFGVTMAEKGVSQLVSVDLTRAAGLREAS